MLIGVQQAPGAAGSLTNPLPEPLPSGLSVEVTPWLTLPASSTGSLKARINHLKPCPGDTRLFCNDLRGKLWVISSKPATSATLFLDFASHFPDFIHSPGLGTVFFRFYLVGQNHDANWGLSEQSAPSSSSHFKVQMRSISTAPGEVQVKDGSTYATPADIRPQTWYSAWLQVRNGSGTSNDRYDLYLQGGDFGVPTLVKSCVRFTAGTSSSLKTFFWRFGPAAEVYFDDLHVDSGHANLSAPVAPDWRLVDHFENPSPLAAWDLPAPEAQSATLVLEPDGNHFLRRTASSTATANPNAIAAKTLPFATQVSQSLTLFFRLRLEGGNLMHQLGVSSADPADPSQYSEATDFAGTALPAGLHLLPSSSWSRTDHRLTLNSTASQVSGMVARPGGYALLPGDWRNSTLTV